jgi:hypothetical protein
MPAHMQHTRARKHIQLTHTITHAHTTSPSPARQCTHSRAQYGGAWARVPWLPISSRWSPATMSASMSRSSALWLAMSTNNGRGTAPRQHTHVCASTRQRAHTPAPTHMHPRTYIHTRRTRAHAHSHARRGAQSTLSQPHGRFPGVCAATRASLTTQHQIAADYRDGSRQAVGCGNPSAGTMATHPVRGEIPAAAGRTRPQCAARRPRLICASRAPRPGQCAWGLGCSSQTATGQRQEASHARAGRRDRHTAPGNRQRNSLRKNTSGIQGEARKHQHSRNHTHAHTRTGRHRHTRRNTYNNSSSS